MAHAKRPDKRALIVDAGRTALLERGIAHVRLADVASAAGLTPPGVLYHYPDIFALFDEAFRTSGEAYWEERRAAVSRATGAADRLRACIRSGIPHTDSGVDATRLFIELQPFMLRDPGQVARWQRWVDDQVSIYVSVLEQGVDEGVFRLTGPAHEIGADLIALEDGYAASILSGKYTADYVEERMWAYAERACGLGGAA